MKLHSVKTKILLSTLACILVIGVFSYSFLYNSLVNDVLRRSEEMEALTLQQVQYQLDTGLDRLNFLGIAVANRYEVASSMLHTDASTLQAKKDLIRAQQLLTEYYKSSEISSYVDKLMVFNASGLMVQSSAKQLSYFNDVKKVRNLDLFKQLQQSGEKYLMGVSPSITSKSENCIAMVGLVEYFGLPSGQGWFYLELNMDFFAATLAPYMESGIFLALPNSISSPFYSAGLLEDELLNHLQQEIGNQQTISYNGYVYRTFILPLRQTGLQLYACSDITILASDKTQIFVTVGVVAITSVAAVLLLAVLLTLFVSRPLKRLTNRIKKITENDFSFDPEIEKSKDEIAEVGKVVNSMTLAIGNLLDETKEMYEQRKNAEIALLQSQVNPHFLYNTLDSIHWMAIIQNNPGIAKTSRSLSNLLRNLAKNTGEKLTLEKEISLLQDYVDTQTVRFMEMFEMVNQIPQELMQLKIVKFTLQPLVENAIFHGLEPSGKYGTITLNAWVEEEFLVITVQDNGVGMTEQEVQNLSRVAANPHPSGMSGIGVSNVNNRLRLVYGPPCGLTYSSKVGEGTCVTVRILKEE